VDAWEEKLELSATSAFAAWSASDASSAKAATFANDAEVALTGDAKLGERIGVRSETYTWDCDVNLETLTIEPWEVTSMNDPDDGRTKILPIR
jgi:hypothetical protein